MNYEILGQQWKKLLIQKKNKLIKENTNKDIIYVDRWKTFAKMRSFDDNSALGSAIEITKSVTNSVFQYLLGKFLE